MTRWPAFALAALVGVLVCGASAQPVPATPGELAAVDEPAAVGEVVPALPWPPPVAIVSAPAPVTETAAAEPTLFPRVALAPPPPVFVEDRTHLTTREMPALEVVGARWYEEERRIPSRLYLERLMAGEVVEGWHWDAGYNVEGAAQVFARALDKPVTLGFEGRVERTTDKHDPGDHVDALMVGPSMLWHPSQRTQLALSPLVGVGSPFPMSEVFLVFGWKF